MNDSKVLIKRYTIRRTGTYGKTLETSIPRLAFDREARRLGLSFEDAVKQLEAVWRFDDFPGLYLTFERKGEGGCGGVSES